MPNTPFPRADTVHIAEIRVLASLLHQPYKTGTVFDFAVPLFFIVNG